MWRFKRDRYGRTSPPEINLLGLPRLPSESLTCVKDMRKPVRRVPAVRQVCDHWGTLRSGVWRNAALPRRARAGAAGRNHRIARVVAPRPRASVGPHEIDMPDKCTPTLRPNTKPQGTHRFLPKANSTVDRARKLWCCSGHHRTDAAGCLRCVEIIHPEESNRVANPGAQVSPSIESPRGCDLYTHQGRV